MNKFEVYENRGCVQVFILDQNDRPVAAYGYWQEREGSLRDAIAGLEGDPDSWKGWPWKYGEDAYMLHADENGEAPMELTLQEFYDTIDTFYELIAWTDESGKWLYDRSRMSYAGLIAFGLDEDDDNEPCEGTEVENEKIREGLALAWCDWNGGALWVATFRKPVVPVPPNTWWDTDNAEDLLHLTKVRTKEEKFFMRGHSWEIWATKIEQIPYDFQGGGGTFHEDVKLSVYGERLLDIFVWQRHVTQGPLHRFTLGNASLMVLGVMGMRRFPKRPSLCDEVRFDLGGAR